jgi:hypothetical protein
MLRTNAPLDDVVLIILSSKKAHCHLVQSNYEPTAHDIVSVTNYET